MKRVSPVALLLVALTVGTEGCQGLSNEFTAEDESAIREMFMKTPELFQSGDWTTWTGYWAEDVSFRCLTR